MAHRSIKKMQIVLNTDGLKTRTRGTVKLASLAP
jgi:hypothetical protein